MKKAFYNIMLYNRQRQLLGLIDELNKYNINSITYIIKSAFLLKNEGFDIAYDFFPYKYGPYSQTIYWDLEYLKNNKLIDIEEQKITNEGKKEIKIDNNIVKKLSELTKRFNNSKKIEDFVYENYKEYTIRSVLKNNKIKKQSGKYTIGYEGKSIDYFLNQLIQNNITTLIDVRKNPISMKRGFSKSYLKKAVENSKISYLHISELGIESNERKNLETKSDYNKLFKNYSKTLPKKEKELKIIKNLAKKERVAIMCFEKDQCDCHRGQISNYIGGFLHL